MKTVTIRRCGVGNAILNLTEKVRQELQREQDFRVEVVNGEAGEFKVLVDGKPVSQKGDDDGLPQADDVLTAVRDAAGINAGA